MTTTTTTTNPEKPILSDPSVLPDEKLLESIIGTKIEWWHMIMDQTIQNYPNVTPVWRYYNDGKQWLFRLMQKKNTIFWVSMLEDTFRITFYLPDKAEPLIGASHLPDELKLSFINGKRYGKIRGITVKMDSQQDVDKVSELVKIRLQLL